MEAGIAQSV